MILFHMVQDIAVILEKSAPESIRMAARDLQRDLRALSGQEAGFPIQETGEGRGIYVSVTNQGDKESYQVKVEENKVLIEGADALGAVYGIYAFATRCLQIPPVHRLTDLFPARKEALEIAEASFASGPHPVRFRGWFLNDEDLLSDYKISGGKRYINYPFYQNVVDVEVMDMVLETALRLEINLVIPASFMDVDNPDEEKLIDLAVRRGLYVSQHHIEPMGVSYFAAEHYMQTRGHENEAVSFISNRARMEEIWRYYAKKWQKYGRQVIWQLGLRGKGDQAVWVSDPTVPVSMADRGGIITDAIRTQYNIVKETLGTEDFYSTATLWNEGSQLYGEGYLKMPESTVPVFSDFGVDQMFGKDFFTTKREADRKYGVYYHAGFIELGPHLSEGCDPRKMAYCYKAAAEQNNLYYSILNISNVRPLHISAIMNAKIMEDPLHMDVDAAMLAMDRALFGEAGEEVNGLRRSYYDALADFGEKPVRHLCQAWHFYFHDYGELPFVRDTANDGWLNCFGRHALSGRDYFGKPLAEKEMVPALRESEAKWAALCEKMEEAEKKIPADKLAYFRQYLKFQALYMHMLTKWNIACMALVDKRLPRKERKAQGQEGIACLERILKERVVLEEGRWKNWHRGEGKLNMLARLEQTKEKLAELEK